MKSERCLCFERDAVIEPVSSPSIPSCKPNPEKRFYGWVIVAARFCLTPTLGETYWTFGVFFKPLQQ
ncbi:MAG: hypothetical protein ACM34H_10510 [Deltaproteobacteria bacterium]